MKISKIVNFISQKLFNPKIFKINWGPQTSKLANKFMGIELNNRVSEILIVRAVFPTVLAAFSLLRN